LDDITWREYYSYRQNYKSSEHEQEYDTAKLQLYSQPVNENAMKNYKFTKYENGSIGNVDNTVLEESHKPKEVRGETGPRNITLGCEDDDKLQTMENTCEISSSHGSEYDVQSCLLGYTAV
jgi:hypothetical protein